MIINYLKEKWLLIIFLGVVYFFTLSMYYFDTNMANVESNLDYIVVVVCIMTIIFLVIDYVLFSYRVKKIKESYKGGWLNPDLHFSSAIEANAYEIMKNLADNIDEYQRQMKTNTDEERDFITRWIHDIKVPISAIRLLLENDSGAINLGHYPIFDREIKSVEESIEKIFYIMRTNRFSDDYKIKEIGTKKIIMTSLKEYSSFFSYKRIKLDIQGEDMSVLTDSKWSTYIISQLISNAVKYSPEGGTVNIVTKQCGDAVSISVKNMGDGISSQDIGQVFNKGFTSSDRKGFKATGYGLYLSKKISGLLGHELKVKSEAGKWAEFTLIFNNTDEYFNLAKM